MKKILLLLLVISLVGFTNCGGDDDSGSFVGVWIGFSIEVLNCSNENNNKFTPLDCNDQSCYKLELNDDGTFTYQEGVTTSSGEWNGSITFCVFDDGEQLCESFDGSAAGSTLVYSSTNETTGCETTYTFIREEEFNQIDQGQ